MKNKGFSLVELIIVIAIMAVLIGVLAPIYLQYVERTKRTTDCTNIGMVLDACEVLAADPDVIWNSGDEITIVINTNVSGSNTSYSGSGPTTKLQVLAPNGTVSLTASWGPFTIVVEKDANGHLNFEMDDDDIALLSAYSETLANRLE